MISELRRSGGSSPLARGAPEQERSRLPGERIIPARAGSTLGFSRFRNGHEDHPRSRGEHACSKRLSTVIVGSSPLARGAREKVYIPLPICGIIPARAGSTSKIRRRPRTIQDHPRSRGEHPDRFQRVRNHLRIIPARAGSTTSRGNSL